MKTAGIIGGLGPDTTAQFYLEIVFSCLKQQASTRPPILMWNVPIPVRVEEAFITYSTGSEVYIPLLIDAAKRLEKGGADFIVIPCNSVHIFLDDVRKAVAIPVLSIVEETVAFLSKQHILEVGILATSVTLRKNLYEDALHEVGIKPTSPNKSSQEKIGTIINNLVQDTHTQQDKDELLKIIDEFIQKDIKTIVLACTDLQLLVPSHDSVQIFDTMKILAESTVREILA